MKKTNNKFWLTILTIWLVMCMMATVVHAALSESGSGSFYTVGDISYFTYKYTWQMVNDNGENATDTRDTQGAGSVEQGTDSTVLVVSATATKNQNGCAGSNNKMTVTVTNNTGSTINVSYGRPNGDPENATTTVTVKGKERAAGETFTLEADETFTIVLYVARSGGITNVIGTDTLDFNVEIPQTAVTLYPSKYCSYTVGDITVAQNAESAQTVYFDQGITLPLSMTVPEGKYFHGWRVSSVGELMTSTSASFTTRVDAAVYPVILDAAPSNAKRYRVDDSYFAFWEDAVGYAAQKATKKAVIVNDKNGTMPSGLADNGVSDQGGAYVTGTANSVNYIVPEGVTLLIPNDDANTVYTTGPGDSAATPTIFHKLTLVSGTTITVDGAISIAGMQCSAHNNEDVNGVASGPLGYIHMEEGSKITVNSGGNLYAWGYITGSGTIDVYGTVYEDLQIADWRGGSALSSIYNNNKGIMPLSMFYVQNVQVSMTLYHGAVERVSSAAVVGSKYKQFSADFLGTDGMVKLMDSTASLTKSYDEVNDRTAFTVKGNCSIGGISLTVPTGNSLSVKEVTIESSKFYMPMNTTWDFTLESGSNVTIAQDIALLPGSTFVIEGGSNVTLSSGAKICVYDADDWGDYIFYAGNDDDRRHISSRLKDFTTHDHSDEAARDASIQLDGVVDATAGTIFTTTHGANIYSTGTGQIILPAIADSTVYQYSQIDDDNNYKTATAMSIAVTSAQLKNEFYDEDNNLPLYTDTSSSSTTTYIYNAEHGRWDAADDSGEAHRIKTSEVKEPTCTSVGYTTHTCHCGYQFMSDYTPPHPNTDCGHKADTLFNIYGSSVQAGDSLNMFFYVEEEHLSGTDYKAVIQRGQPDGTVKTETIPFKDWSDYTSNGKALYRFVYSGIAAKEMSEQVFVTICNEDGTILSNTYIDSIEAYALDLLGATDDDYLRTALVDMLNYGAACQTHFGYNTAHLANALLTEEQKNYSTSPDCGAETDGSDGYKDYFITHSVSVENSLKYTFFFKDITGETATISYTDHYGKEHTKVVSVTPSGDAYLVDVSDLAIADACPIPEDGRTSIDISCTVTTAKGLIKVTGSIEAYAKDAIAANEATSVCEMLMRFASSAYKYFHNLPISA